MWRMQKIALFSWVGVCLAGCATAGFTVSRIAPAKYDITGINRVGVMGFGTENPVLANSAAVITSVIEDKLMKNGFFYVSRISQQTHPIIFPDSLAKVGRDANVDMLILGLIDAYDAQTLHEMKRIEEEISTGKFRTEYYNEDGIQKSRQIEIKEKHVRFEPVAKREAVVTFRAFALRSDNAKIIGKEIKSDEREFEAEGQDKIDELPSEQYLLNELVEQLVGSFIGDIAPHEETYSIEFKSDRESKPGIKLAKAGDWVDAIASFESAINVNPKNHIAMYNLGVANEHQQNYEAALECYDDAFKIVNKKLYTVAYFRVRNLMIQNERLGEQIRGRFPTPKTLKQK